MENHHPRYRGRVRSGCLTCRSRKVKCDEARPTCKNCARLNRDCAYKPFKWKKPSSHMARKDVEGRLSEAQSEKSCSASTSRSKILAEVQENSSGRESATDAFSVLGQERPQSPQNTAVKNLTARLKRALWCQDQLAANESVIHDTESPFTFISRDIELTTTMDALTAHEVCLEPSLSYFSEQVVCALITPFDAANWNRMKSEIVEMGLSDATIASAIIAVSVLFKAHIHRLPLSKAISVYNYSKSAFERILQDDTQSFTKILVVMFLLCQFEFVHYESKPILRELDDLILGRLDAWTQNKALHTPLTLRICTWLRLFQATTTRGGCMGLLSDRICGFLPESDGRLPNLTPPLSNPLDASTQLYDQLSGPIFEFYFQLEMISHELSKLTHYHRSRITSHDQEEVVKQINNIKPRLYALWEGRSATQSQTPRDLRASFAPKIADPIITLIGICATAYYAEFVEITRILGDPLSDSEESKQAMRQIRLIVDGDWNCYNNEGKLNPGYVRPLFLYSIECMDRELNHWAVEKLRQIGDPIARSGFFASFAQALSDAQLAKDRRVTSNYFCKWYFGVPPPYM